ncbi:MAG: toxin HicA, partial [Lachnospiraceae bacterium]|nr:toxin HicA [Lachnospiraceae bacterium]
MSKWDKLIQRIKAVDHNMRFSEIQKVMESFGYCGSFPNGGSSHCTFRIDGCPPVTIPTHEPIAEI